MYAYIIFTYRMSLSEMCMAPTNFVNWGGISISGCSNYLDSLGSLPQTDERTDGRTTATERIRPLRYTYVTTPHPNFYCTEDDLVGTRPSVFVSTILPLILTSSACGHVVMWPSIRGYFLSHLERIFCCDLRGIIVLNLHVCSHSSCNPYFFIFLSDILFFNFSFFISLSIFSLQLYFSYPFLWFLF